MSTQACPIGEPPGRALCVSDKLAWTLAARYSGNQSNQLRQSRHEPQHLHLQQSLPRDNTRDWTAARGIAAAAGIDNLNNATLTTPTSPMPQRTVYGVAGQFLGLRKSPWLNQSRCHFEGEALRGTASRRHTTRFPPVPSLASYRAVSARPITSAQPSSLPVAFCAKPRLTVGLNGPSQPSTVSALISCRRRSGYVLASSRSVLPSTMRNSSPPMYSTRFESRSCAFRGHEDTLAGARPHRPRHDDPC